MSDKHDARLESIALGIAGVDSWPADMPDVIRARYRTAAVAAWAVLTDDGLIGGDGDPAALERFLDEMDDEPT